MVTSLACGCSPSQYIRQSYANSAFPDFSDGTGIGVGSNPIGSVFDSNGGVYNDGLSNLSRYGMFGGGMCGGMYGGGMYGMGYGPGSEVMNMSQADYLKYQEQLQKQQMQSNERLDSMQLKQQVAQKHRYEGAQMSAEAPEMILKRRATSLQDLIADNEQDQVMAEYNKLKEEVTEQYRDAGYTNVSEEEIRSHVDDAYHKATGHNLKDDLRANGDSELTQGFKEGICGLGLFNLGGGKGERGTLTNKNNYKDNLAEITGTKVSGADKAWRVVGNVLGAAATIVAVPLLAKGGWKLLKGAGKGLKALWKW